MRNITTLTNHPTGLLNNEWLIESDRLHFQRLTLKSNFPTHFSIALDVCLDLTAIHYSNSK